MSSPVPVRVGPREFGDTKDSPVNQVEVTLNQSRFTEFLVRENGLDQTGFKEWVFYPGMLFNSKDKWWGNQGQGKRGKPHEGLDLCLYRDREDRILHLDEKTKIPAMYDGVVVRVMNDFISKSVMMEHRLPESHYPRFCTIYGHTNLPNSLRVGRIVKAGDTLATLARPTKPRTDIPPHLHISLGWILNEISYENLDWEAMTTLKPLQWVDPLQIISRRIPK